MNKDVGVLKKEGFPNQPKQLTFDLVQIDNETVAYEYAVLVTNLEDEIITLSQHIVIEVTVKIILMN
ncbi:MAG: hypothetical protein JSR33_06875 [Proteobacteria bacterium]|nr:hypothetical protein [Pseudomonadota bacterium]